MHYLEQSKIKIMGSGRLADGSFDLQFDLMELGHVYISRCECMIFRQNNLRYNCKQYEAQKAFPGIG